MSAKYMGEVWDLDIPQNEAWVLMAYADHCDHEGGNAWPSAGLVAWKTGYDERSVRRIVGKLRERGILVKVMVTPSGTNCYRLDFAHVPRKAARKPKVNPIKKADPLTICQGGQFVRGSRCHPNHPFLAINKGSSSDVIDKKDSEVDKGVSSDRWFEDDDGF